MRKLRGLLAYYKLSEDFQKDDTVQRNRAALQQYCYSQTKKYTAEKIWQTSVCITFRTIAFQLSMVLRVVPFADEIESRLDSIVKAHTQNLCLYISLISDVYKLENSALFQKLNTHFCAPKENDVF